MLKYYIPVMDGVDIVLCNSGFVPLGGVLADICENLDGLANNQITMENGKCRRATMDEVIARLTSYGNKDVVSEPDIVTKNSGVWRVLERK